MTEPNADRAERIGMLVRMFEVYGQIASEERVTGYLGILAPIPTRSLAESLKTAMAESDGKWPPGPGEIVTSWKSNRGARPEERPYRAPEHKPRTDAVALNPGPVLAQLESRVAPDEHEVLALSAELRRTHAKHFPRHAAQARTPSLVAAAMRLGRHWPMQPDHVAQVTAWMAEAKTDGQDTSWWQSARRAAVTEWRGSYIAGAAAVA